MSRLTDADLEAYRQMKWGQMTRLYQNEELKQAVSSAKEESLPSAARGGQDFQNHLYTQAAVYTAHAAQLASGNQTLTAETMRPGDWICSRCNAMNFANRTSCYKCAVPANLGKDFSAPRPARRRRSPSTSSSSSDSSSSSSSSRDKKKKRKKKKSRSRSRGRKDKGRSGKDKDRGRRDKDKGRGRDREREEEPMYTGTGFGGSRNHMMPHPKSGKASRDGRDGRDGRDEPPPVVDEREAELKQLQETLGLDVPPFIAAPVKDGEKRVKGKLYEHRDGSFGVGYYVILDESIQQKAKLEELQEQLGLDVPPFIAADKNEGNKKLKGHTFEHRDGSFGVGYYIILQDD